ncbi:MAG: hypothetical protein ACXABY_22095, partial [Candidatus Thorarchaeota archaeon]
MPYTKTPHFNVTSQVGARDASLSAYMRSVPTPVNTIEFKNRANEIESNADTDFEWRECPVIVSSGYVTFNFMEDLGGGGATPTTDWLSVFGAYRLFYYSFTKGGYVLGDLSMRLTDFTFTPDANMTLRRVVLNGMKNTKYQWNGFGTHNVRPTLYYSLYISDVTGGGYDLPDVSGSDESIFPYDGGPSTNTAVKINVADILIDGSEPSTTEYVVRIPTTPYSLTSGNKYAFHLVPINAVGPYGMDVDVTIAADDAPYGNLVTASVMMSGVPVDAPLYGTEPLANTAEQDGYWPNVTLQAAVDYLHYVDRDVDFQPLDIVNNDDTKQLIVTGTANRTAGGVAFPLAYSYDLKFDSYTAPGRGLPQDTVNFTRDDGLDIDKGQYRITSDSSSSRETNSNAYKSTIHMTEDLAQSNTLSKVKYTRVLNDAVQVNYKDVVDPQETAKYDRDFAFGFTVYGNVLFLKSEGSLGSVGENETVWIKKRSVYAINALPPLGSPTSAWKPRVTVGTFTVSDVETIYGVKSIVYNIPDISGQPVAVNWAGGYTTPAASGSPYLSKAFREPVYKVDPYTMQLPRKNVYFWDGDWGSGNSGGDWTEGLGTYPTYLVPNIIDAPAVTGHVVYPMWSHGINLYDGDTVVDNSTIYGWNKINGVLKLNRPLSSDREVTATYLYEQREVEIDVDLNPTIHHPNANRVGDTVRVVLKPEWDTYAADTGDTDPNKLAWHWVSDNPSGTYIYDVATSSGTWGYAFRDGSVVGLPNHTVVLGDYTIGEASPYEANLIDTRSRGGGLKDDEWFTSRGHLKNRPFEESPV